MNELMKKGLTVVIALAFALGAFAQAVPPPVPTNVVPVTDTAALAWEAANAESAALTHGYYVNTANQVGTNVLFLTTNYVTGTNILLREIRTNWVSGTYSFLVTPVGRDGMPGKTASTSTNLAGLLPAPKRIFFEATISGTFTVQQ
jgi:hypothetical protein